MLWSLLFYKKNLKLVNFSIQENSRSPSLKVMSVGCDCRSWYKKFCNFCTNYSITSPTLLNGEEKMHQNKFFHLAISNFKLWPEMGKFLQTFCSVAEMMRLYETFFAWILRRCRNFVYVRHKNVYILEETFRNISDVLYLNIQRPQTLQTSHS